MQILFITSRFPYPPLRGDQALPYHRLRLLSKKHRITLLSFYSNSSELAGLEHMRLFCDEIHTVKLPTWKSIANVGSYSLFSSLPLQVLYYQSSAFKARLKSVLAQNSFDIVHVYLLRLAPYLSDICVPKVLELIDSMQLNWHRRMSIARQPERILLSEELRRVTAYEKSLSKCADQLIVVSERDKKFIPGENTSVIPLGVDANAFRPSPSHSKQCDIIFSGNMGYSPNVSAVVWFVSECLPYIQTVVPGVSFTVVGTNPSRRIRELVLRHNFHLTGHVESMPEALSSAKVAIAPMLSGSGMQFKILEAMSCGLPVVTTSLGLGDIKALPGRDLSVADSPREFSDAVIQYLRNPELAAMVGRDARSFIEKCHSWESGVSQLEAIYSKLANVGNSHMKTSDL